MPTPAIDIEHVLQWAINDELPKGQHVMKPVWKSIEDHARKASTSTFEGVRQYQEEISGGYVAGTPHDDALIVSRLVHAFDSVVGLSELFVRGLLGSLVNIDPIGIRVAMSVTPNVAGLILTHAALKRAPEVDLRMPQPFPVRRKSNGRPLVLREDADGDLIEDSVKDRRGFLGSPRCPLEWKEPTVERVAEQRAEYSIWWRALAMLADKLNALPRSERPTSFIATRPARPERPWQQPAPKARRILTAAA